MPVTSLEHVSTPEKGGKAAVRHTAERAERRKRARTNLQLDLLVLRETGAIESATRDLSSKGFYCSSPVPFLPGERMVCLLKVPTYHPERSGHMLSLECQVRIVRVDPPDEQGFYGLGCQIDEYRFLQTR